MNNLPAQNFVSFIFTSIKKIKSYVSACNVCACMCTSNYGIYTCTCTCMLQTLNLVIFQVQFIFHSLFNRPINLSCTKRPKVIFKRHLNPRTYSHSKIVYYDVKISITNNVQNEFSATPPTKKAIHFFQIKNQLPPQPLALFYQFQSPVTATTTTDHHPTSTHLTNMTKHQSNPPLLSLSNMHQKFQFQYFFFPQVKVLVLIMNSILANRIQ